MQFTTSVIAMKVWDRILADPPASLSLLLVAVLLLANFLGSLKVIFSVMAGGLACYAWLSTMQENVVEARSMPGESSPIRPVSKFAAIRPVRRRLDKASARKDCSAKKRFASPSDMVNLAEPVYANSQVETIAVKKVDDSIIPVKNTEMLLKKDGKAADSGDDCLQKCGQKQVSAPVQNTPTPMDKLLQFVARDHKSHQGKWNQNGQNGATQEEDLEKMRDQVKVQQSMIDVLLQFKDPDVSRLISEVRPRIAALQDKIDAMMAMNHTSTQTNAVTKTPMALRPTAKPFEPQSSVLPYKVSREEKILRGWAMGGTGRTTPFTCWQGIKAGTSAMDSGAYGSNAGILQPPPGLEPDAWMAASSPISAQ